MASTDELLGKSGFGETYRHDNWWSHPFAVFVGLSLFIVYGLFRTVYPLVPNVEAGISHGALLSPFYSPLFFSLEEGSRHALFGTFPEWWPALLASPAILILWAPLGLRTTCYYYRKAYYRAFFQDPPACAVGEPRSDYEGETGLLIFQNLHRYFLYLGLVFIVFLSFEAVRAMFWGAPAGEPFWAGNFEIHVGTLVLALNAFLLAGYTLGCHSFRYLVGGNSRCFSCEKNPANGGGGDSEKSLSKGYSRWKAVTKLNVNHSTWAWYSLFMVAFADFYVWMVAIEVFPDVTLFAL